MHLNIEHLLHRIPAPDGTAAVPGEEGTIVITDLFNRGMPFIRYRIEDVGVPSDRHCGCGRGLPLMERVTGRVADYLKRTRRLDGGRRVARRTHADGDTDLSSCRWCNPPSMTSC